MLDNRGYNKTVMKTPKDATKENVALILAARQLGNAVYGHPDNIKKARISKAVLQNHAKKLMGTKERYPLGRN